MPKRKASSYNAASGRRFAGASGGSRRAAAIGARLAARYPYSGFGRMYVPKGSFTAAAGESYRAANAEQRAWRKANNFSGVGGFWGDAWRGAKGLAKAHGAKALGYLGGQFAGPGGAALGVAAGKAMGMGSYRMGGVGSYGEISSNDIVHGGSGDSMSIAKVNPTMSDDSGDVVMSHSEFIGNVVATASIPAGSGATVTVQSTFQNSIYAINPGLQQSFPFLCQLAQNYTMYRLEGCIYQYKPTSGEGGGSTNQLGKVIMATDYDPMALPFINSVQMENYQYSQSTKPSLAARHGVECAPTQGVTDMKYVRTGLSNRDKSFTDYGLFQLATEGVPITGVQGTTASANIGELWVSYKVRLSRANLYSSLLGYNIRNDIFDCLIPTGAAIAAGQLIPQNLLGIQNTPNLNNIGTILKARAGSGIYGDSITIEFPTSQILGVYKITVYSDRANVDTASRVTQWLPMLPGAYTEATFLDKTQWGCTFTPCRNYTQDAKVSANVDLTTGAPIWQDVSIGSGGRKQCFFSDEITDTVSPYSQSTFAYFAINSPTTTIAKMSFMLYNMNLSSYTGSVYNAPTVNSVHQGSFLTDNFNIKVMVEQVNAEISN